MTARRPTPRPPMVQMLFANSFSDLSDDEWADICSRSNLSPSDEARWEISINLGWCNDANTGAAALPRRAEVLKRFRKVLEGADLLLGALGYLEVQGLATCAARPPTTSHGWFGQQNDGLAAWGVLRSAALADDWSHSLTSRALARSGPEEALVAIHALAYTAACAVETWRPDVGGRRTSGDLQFLTDLCRTLDAHGLSTDYTHDRDAEGEAMGGGAWEMARAIWNARPNAFASKTSATLAAHFRKARMKARNEPRKKPEGSLP